MKVNVKRFITVLILLILISFVSGFIAGKAFSQKRLSMESEQQVSEVIHTASISQEQELKPITFTIPNQYTASKSDIGSKAEENWMTFTATAYCPCEKCCGKWAKNRPNGIVYTASGEVAREGVTIAADWNVLPKGTKVEIKGIGFRVVQDRGGAIQGNRIDIYFDSHQEALEFGVQEVQLRIKGSDKNSNPVSSPKTSTSIYAIK